MPYTLRRASERGHANFGWLDSHHSFSFGDYYDPAYMGFGSLRVINDDRVAAGAGFPMHGHRDMEIISYVLEGALEHKDSIGTGSVIAAGDVQRMSAGSGIRHSEFNPSDKDAVHFLQIWIMPNEQGITPSYEQKTFPRAMKENRLRLIASHDGRDGSLTINANTDIYASLLSPHHNVTFTSSPQKRIWVQMARGAATFNGVPLHEGDGLALAQETALHCESADQEAEFIIFDMAEPA